MGVGSESRLLAGSGKAATGAQHTCVFCSVCSFVLQESTSSSRAYLAIAALVCHSSSTGFA